VFWVGCVGGGWLCPRGVLQCVVGVRVGSSSVWFVVGGGGSYGGVFCLVVGVTVWGGGAPPRRGWCVGEGTFWGGVVSGGRLWGCACGGGAPRGGGVSVWGVWGRGGPGPWGVSSVFVSRGRAIVLGGGAPGTPFSLADP